MKSTKPFHTSGRDIYSDEGKKPKKPINGQAKEKNHKKRFTEIDDEDDTDIDFDYKKRESIADYMDDEEEEEEA